MKACFRLGLAAVATAGLMACATTSQHEPRITPSSDIKLKPDADYIIAVEKAARRSGVGVIWVHPPSVRVDD
jgi:hypothetical protein